MQRRDTSTAMRCARCGRFISPDTCLQGHDGTIFGQFPDDDGYTEDYYCEIGTGCNAELGRHNHACCPPDDCCGGPCDAHPCWELTT